MTQKVKNILGIAIIAALLCFAYAVVNYVSSYSRSIEPSSFRSFSVSAEGKTTAVPDIAKFSFSVITEGDTDISLLQEENTQKMNQAVKFVKDQGVEKEDIRTERYSLEPRYQYYRCEDGPCPPREIVGYTIYQTAEVKIRDFEKIGIILGGVVENEANTVSKLSFIIDDPTEVENEARAEAIEKAKKKAEAIAKAGGFDIGRLLSISESGTDQVRAQAVYMEKAASGMGGDSTPSIEPGSQEVEINIVLKYEIK